MLRYEARNPVQSDATFYSTDPLTFISDYSIGVQYGINQVIGNCSVRGIRSNDFGQDAQFTETYMQSGLGFAIRLKSPESFLNLDNEYIFTGKREINGISSDRYISNATQLEINSFYEYYFSRVSCKINEFETLISFKFCLLS